MFGSLFKSKAKDAFAKMTGRKDALEAMCAACALTAAAEGGIDAAEENKAIKVIGEKLKGAFNENEIEREFIKRSKQTGTRSGKSDLRTEIEQVVRHDSAGEMGQAIVLLCLDVADEGGIGPQEETVIRQIAGICNQDYDKLAA